MSNRKLPRAELRSTSRSLPRSRSRIVAVGLLVALGLCVFYWRDLCLWRSEACLTNRNARAAQQWLAWADVLGTTQDANVTLLRIRVARRMGDFALVEKLLRDPSISAVKRGELDRERWLAMAQTNQFHLIQSRWSVLLSDQRDDGPEIAKAYYTWCMLNHNIAVAQRTLELWQADYPNDPEPWILAGKFYESLVNWRLAEESYRKAATLLPNDVSVLIAWAGALRILLKTDEAQQVYQKCLKLDATSIEAARGLAQCESADGDFTAAAVILKESLGQHPQDFGLLKDYGEVLLAGGEEELAVGILQQAYLQVPEHANLAYSLGKALKATGRSVEAEPLMAFVAESRLALDRLNHLERQLRTSPKDLELRMEIASLTAKYVSRQDAVGWYRQLLAVSPHFEPAQRAMETLQRELGDVKQSNPKR